MLSQGAVVLLITDGLERDGDDTLEFEIDRLHRSCRRLIWLNPLLRFDGFEARARGVKAMLPHVDEFRRVHNLDALAEFNRLWSRRVLGQGATVLLITDGLERDDVAGLSEEMERLHKSCRRLVWLNPLLRFDGFEARARGVRAMLPHVDEFRPVHNLDALADLVASLDRRGRADVDPRRWLGRKSGLASPRAA
jgi:uncharacterized protein with von Willebrand factor type A (vWA) domain